MVFKIGIRKALGQYVSCQPKACIWWNFQFFDDCLVTFGYLWHVWGVPVCPKMHSPVQGEYFWYRGRENRPTRKKDRSVWKPVFKSNLTPQSSWSREMTFHFWRQKKRSWYVSIKFLNSKKWMKNFRQFSALKSD